MLKNSLRLALIASLISLLATQPLCAQEPGSNPSTTTSIPPSTPPQTAETTQTLARGTNIKFVLLDSVSSETASKGQSMRLAVARDVLADGQVVIPRGTLASGVITRVRKGIPGVHDGQLTLEPRELVLSSGKRLKLKDIPPGEDRCGDMGPCWALATFAIVVSPVVIATVVIASPWLIHDAIKEKKESSHRKPVIAGKDETLCPCRSFNAYTASTVVVQNTAAPSNPAIDSAILNQIAKCPAP